MSELEILYEDNHIIVVVKPCNVLSQRDSTGDEDMLTIIKKYIKEKYNKPGNVYLGLVHRLDRPVSGVMVFAKTSKAASRLSEQMKKNSFSKKYLAVVNDNAISDDGVYEDYLLKTDDGKTIISTEDEGKYSKLHYKVVEKNKESKMVLVSINLESGRHHQIRVQFASRGHVIYGDQRYGTSDKKQIALHAYEISFEHPVTHQIMTFSTMPKNKSDGWEKFVLTKMTK